MPHQTTGRKMTAAAEFVAAHAGCTKMAAADAIGPNGSRRYGYDAVNRAIRAGLIEASKTRKGYSLTVR